MESEVPYKRRVSASWQLSWANCVNVQGFVEFVGVTGTMWSALVCSSIADDSVTMVRRIFVLD